MADMNSLLELVAQRLGPEKLQETVDQAEAQLAQDPDVTLEGVQEALKQFEFVAANPDRYKEVVASAAQAGLIDVNDVPNEFNPLFVGVMILALRELLARMQQAGQQGFAKGGLARAAKQLAAQGRGGDTMLAHINPKEAEVLRRMGGAGTVNPNTGLHEFKGGVFKAVGKIVKSVAKAVVPIAATTFFGPAGGAIAGAAMGAIGGGGFKGALLGGITGSLVPGGYLGDIAKTVGSGIVGALPQSIASILPSAQVLGSGVLGGLASSVAGKGFLPGAIQAGGMAAAAPGVNKFLSGVTGPGGIFSSQAAGTGVKLGSQSGLGQVGSSVLSDTGTAGSLGVPNYDLASGITGGAPGINLGTYNPGAAIKDTAGNWAVGLTDTAAANAGNIAPAAGTSGSLLGNIDTGTLLKGAVALNALGGITPQQAQMQIANSSMSPEQKESMSRALTNYTANWNQAKLPEQGTPEYDQMMNQIYQGIGQMYVQPTLTQPGTVPGMKRGGALAMLAQGTGSGRDDTINAKLSDGEYVIDAETVALLGNGSTKAGAAALDQMREQIRKQKGRMLAKGKFSPNAKSPLAYMKGRA